MRINLKQIYFKLILLFPIVTLFQTYIGPINKCVFALLLIIQFLLFVKKLSYKKFIWMIIVVLIFIFDLLITKGILYNINELFYLPFAIMYMSFLKDNFEHIKEFFFKNKKYVDGILIIWSSIVLFSIFLKSSWTGGWGAGLYFGSLCKSVFRLAPSALFIGTLALCSMKIFYKKNYFYFLLLPLFCFLMGGSRTYMVVGLLLFIVGWYLFSNSKKFFYLTIIPISMLLLIFILNSSMMDKFEAVSYKNNSYFDFWGTITSGRSIFWKADINYYINTNIIHKLFGSGFNCIYEINYKAFGGLVWGHNDFIQILLSHGIIMLYLYIKKVLDLFKLGKTNLRDKMLYRLAFIIWLFNAFFNMCYTYFCAMLCIPFLITIISESKKVR